MSEKREVGPVADLTEVLTAAEEAALDAHVAAVLEAGWEAFECSLAADQSFWAAQHADLDVSLAALRAARQAADLPPAAPGVQPDASAASPLSAQLDAVQAALDALLAAPASGERADVARTLRLTETLRLAGLRELAQMHLLGTHTVAGGPRRSTSGWLSDELDLTAAAAGSAVRLANELRELPVIAEAVSSGAITSEHARAIADGVRGLDLATVQDCQAQLLTLSAGLDPVRVRDGLKNLALALDDRLAAEAERKARERAGFTLSPVGDRYASSGSHDAEAGALLAQALELAAQQLRDDGDDRPVAARRAQVLVDWARRALHESAESDSTSQDIHTSRTHLIVGATVDQLDAASAGDAVCTCGGRTRQDSPVGSDGAHDLNCSAAPTTESLAEAVEQALDAGPGEHPGRSASNISAGTSLSRGALRRLACDAIIGIVALGKDPREAANWPQGAQPSWRWQHGNTDPLYVGRSARTVTKAQWIALVARDRHCAVRGCRIPPAGCIAHHVRHWLDGGGTDLDNLVLLCERHHHAHHDGQQDLPHRDGTRWMTQHGWSAPDPALLPESTGSEESTGPPGAIGPSAAPRGSPLARAGAPPARE